MKKPNVVIDARMLTEVRHGIARFVEDLIQGFEPIQEELEYEIIFLIHPSMDDSDIWGEFQTAVVEASFLSRAELIGIPRALKDLKADLYFSPSFSSLPFYPCKYVMTLHDLNHLTYGSMAKKLYYRTLVGPAARFADQLTTVSRTSCREIANWLELPAKSIEILSPAVPKPLPKFARNKERQRKIVSDFGLTPQKYLFAPINSKPHKNARLLIDAYLESGSKDDLVFPLDPREATEVWSRADVRPPSIRFLGGLPEMEMEALLSQAKAILFPSLYEGFGRPPLEALIRGVPALVSDISVHREICGPYEGEGVEFYSPKRAEDWSHALRKWSPLEPPSIAPKVKRDISKRFSTDALAKAVDRICRDVLSI